MNCDLSCKDKADLFLKLVFVAVFTYGVMSTVCCIKSCSSTQQVSSAKQCGLDCQKACCKK